jgi:AcrR family transcriptional regulator
MSKATTRERPRGQHRTTAANRQRILDATLRVAEKYGYQGTTIPRVSLLAKLPTGSVYWHFESKDMLFAALMEQGGEWVSEFHRQRRPLPGETTREHLDRIFCKAGQDASRPAHDFWRLGVILSIDQSVREQVSRQRFLNLRKKTLEEYASWYRQTLPANIQRRCPDRVQNLAKYTLMLADGNLIMTASGETMRAYLLMAGLSLISLAEADPKVFP